MTDKLTEKSIRSFLTELATSAPGHVSGHVAVLYGTLDAALISMVSNLTTDTV